MLVKLQAQCRAWFKNKIISLPKFLFLRLPATIEFVSKNSVDCL
jgi:hypothetical protein